MRTSGGRGVVSDLGHPRTRGDFVKPVRRACARGSKFGQDASKFGQGARSASEIQACWLDKGGLGGGQKGQIFADVGWPLILFSSINDQLQG